MIYLKNGQIERIYSTGFSMKVPEGVDTDMHIRPVTTLSDQQSGETSFEIFKFGSETIVMPTIAADIEEVEYEPPSETGKGLEPQKVVPVEPAVIEEEPEGEDEDEETSTWEVTERDIQREIGRYSNGEIMVEMLSATKAVVYIDDRDVPAAIGKGGKNIAAIVNKVGVGIDIRPASELAKRAKGPGSSAPVEKEELNLGEGLQVRIDKKQLSIISADS
jgi:ATPase